MAFHNITIQHTSPLITFNGGWVQYDSNGADFSVTQNLGASATFTFPGKWVQIKGTKNEYHGAFSVSIDGQAYNRSGATSGEEQELVATIFNMSLGDVQHTMVIRNDEWAALNIESITWTCAIGTNSSATQLETFSVAASDPSFTFLPKGDWTANATLQSTSAAEASVNYTFSVRDAVSIFGSSGPDNAAYSVWRDGEAPQYFNATRSLSTPDVRLYFASGFGSGEHTIMLKSESTGLFQIQRAEVITASGSPSPGPQGVSPGTTTSTSPARSSTPTIKPEPGVARSNTRLSAGAVAAISCAAVLLVFLLLAVWLLLRRNKALWMRLQRGYMVQSQFDQFDSSSPPTGVTPLILPAQSRPPSPRRKLQVASDDEETFQAPALVRPGTTLSQMTASTLVAEAGSDMIQVGANGLKPLHLASRFRSGTTTTTAYTRNTIDSAGQRSPALASTIASPRHSRPARSDTGNSNGDYYDPYITAAH
uniref:Transmembrane protein n=1 Tax=Mycena chlorophos TaxID=658473 RepID=A0ABQ0LK19_MYCCL|nr:predicted protein [Mycena chlorophos]